MKFRKKPVVIEAVQYDGFNKDEIDEFVGRQLGEYVISDAAWQVGAARPITKLVIPTLEGNMDAIMGDYIIKGVKGEFYPCKSDIFEQTYNRIGTPLDRMKTEIDDLVDRCLKLKAFMETDNFLALDNETIGLLEAQYGAMMAYSHILQLRVAKMRKDNKE